MPGMALIASAFIIFNPDAEIIFWPSQACRALFFETTRIVFPDFFPFLLFTLDCWSLFLIPAGSEPLRMYAVASEISGY